MDVEDDHFLNVFKGKRVKLTLKTSSYVGVIQRINTNKTLVLAKVVSGSNGCKISGSKMFFGHEILNVELVEETSAVSGANVGSPEDRIQTNADNDILDLEDDEDDCVNFVVVNEFQEKFGAAVMYIKKQHVIGVGGDGVEVYKNGRLCWLQIATKSKIYLFDILMLGARAFKNGLSTVLENKQILKVIHDCRALSGCLFGQFGVKLNYVFDTQVADVLCFYSETGGSLPDRVSTLEQVVSLHLQVPSFHLLSLQMKSQLTKEDMKLWQMRPCPVPLLKLMALSVIHLQPLRLVLLDNLMRDFMTLVDSYLNSSHYEPDEVQHVTMETLMELPLELKELVQIHRKRQEQAADRYPVNDQGLLARFSPRVQSPPRPSPATLELSSTRTDSDEPAAAKSPSSVQVDLIIQNGPVSPRSATTVLSPDVCASPDPGLPPEPSLSNLREDRSPNVPAVPLGAGRGHIEVTTRAEGRRRPFGKVQSSSLPLPTIRREVVPPTTSSSLQSSVVSLEQCGR